MLNKILSTGISNIDDYQMNVSRGLSLDWSSIKNKNYVLAYEML